MIREAVGPGTRVLKRAAHLPWEIHVATKWPTSAHKLFLPDSPLMVAGLPFATQRLSLGIGHCVVDLIELKPVKQ